MEGAGHLGEKVKLDTNVNNVENSLNLFFLRDIVHRKEILGDKTVTSGRDYQRLEIFQRLLK